MIKVCKITFGAIIALSMVAPSIANAHVHDPYNHLAGWIAGTYYKPSNNGLSIGDQLFAASPFDNAQGTANFDGGRRAVFLDPQNSFDYAFGFSYRMPHTHTRLFISYEHYSTDIDHDGQIDIRNFGFAPGELDPVAGNAITQTDTNTSYDLTSNEFRAGIIHDLHFGDRFCLDLLAFVEYDKLKQTVNETLFTTEGFVVGGGGGPAAPVTENRFRGFGPGVGFMTRWYSHCPHWHLFAGGNTTLLVASNKYTTNSLVTATDFFIYEPEQSESVTGKIDIEFGINYHHALKREMHGMKWDIALGMRYMNIFNALKNGNTAFNPNAGPNNNVVANFAPNLGPAQDWGRYGPFLKFSLGGAHS